MNMKKLLALALTLSLLISAISIISVSAEYDSSDNLVSGDYKYEILEDGTASIVAYEGTKAHLTFPTEIDGFKVTEIYNPFYQNETIKSVTVPEGIKKAYIFGANNMEKLSLPESLEEFDAYCIWQTEFYKNPKNWENGALYLGNRLLDTDTTKVSGAFKVKDGTKYISRGALAANEKLTEVILPDSLVRIESGAFVSSTALNKVTFGKGLEHIGDYAFEGCKDLKEIALPEGVAKIGYGTFSECGLEKISFPSTLKVIENEAFSSCENLKNITIPPSVTHLGSAFSFCENLSEVNLPDTLEFIGRDAFHATAYANNPQNYEDDLLYYGKYLLDYSEDFGGTCKIKEGTKIIADRFFASCDTVTSVIFPDDIEGIGDNFFSWCENLETVRLPKNLTVIGKYAFGGCTKLSNVNIPDGTTEIAENAFLDCDALSYISIPASVVKIAPYSIGYEKDFDIPSGFKKAESAANLTIAGYTGTKAEKYAFENDLSFKNLSTSEEYKYKDKVIKLLENPEISIYHESYEHYSSPKEAIPDFVLITAFGGEPADMEITKIFGDYVLYSPDLKYPGGEFGYYIYLPNKNEIYTLTKAFEKGIEGVYNVFTEGYIGELLGDVNYDNKLNIRDATMIQHHLAGYDNMNIESVHGGYTLPVADFNCDGKLNIRDATAIQKRLAKLDKKSLEYTVLDTSEIFTSADFKEVKNIAKTKAQFETMTSQIIEPDYTLDTKFTDEYFEQNSVIIIADKTAQPQVVDNVSLIGPTVTVHRYVDTHEEATFYQCLLIEVDKESVDFALEIKAEDTYALICY